MLSKDELLKERENLTQQLKLVEDMLKLRYNWKPPAAEVAKTPMPQPMPVKVTAVRPRSVEPVEEAPEESLPYVKLAEEWVLGARGNVTVNDFWNWLVAKFGEGRVNPNSINAPVRKLENAGKLRTVRQGSGRAPTIYTVVSPGLGV